MTARPAPNPWRRLPEDAPVARPGTLDPDAVVETRAPPNNGVPNHPCLPALIYPAVLGEAPDIERVKALFERNRWFRVWDWTVFDYHHFHPSAAEVLAVARGHARIRLGGPDGTLHEVRAGDVMVLPAGFGHCREASTEDFTVVGAYPEGQEEREVVRASAEAAEAARPVIERTPLPSTDPVYGERGPLRDLWRDAASG